MDRLLAETPRDQEMIDKLQREYEKLKNTVDRLQEENNRITEENRKLREQIDEYGKRHPSTVGIKNGKVYEIREEYLQRGASTRNPGAQPGHRGHFRKIPQITERITLRAGEFTCPICSSTLVRKGIRKRVIEDIPEIHPRVVQYKIERMYCRRCRKTYEPQTSEVYWTPLELDNLIEETCLHRHKSQQVGITVTHQEVIDR